ncbi:hypothetical protein D3C79_993030 [compost metagenome]
MPPLSALWKKASSSTSLASVVWARKRICTLSYLVRRNRVIQKKKLRATYFSKVPMEPEVSIIASTTAEDCGRSISSQVL